MVDKPLVLAVNALFLSLPVLAAAFQCCAYLQALLIIQSLRQRQLAFQLMQQYNAAARLRRIRRRIVYRRGRV